MTDYEIMVEPPEGAVYVAAAYNSIERLKPNRLAWTVPADELDDASELGRGQKAAELATLPRITNAANRGVSGMPSSYRRRHMHQELLGVVYADSPLANEKEKNRLETVSVVVSGLVTIVDPVFETKATCGQFVYVDTFGSLAVASTKPPNTVDQKYWKVGMLMEVGHRSDARVLLGIEAP